MRKLAVFALCGILMCQCAFAYDELEISLEALIMVESSGNTNAVSFLGAKYGRGLCQISEIALKDWENYHWVPPQPVERLFDPEYNKKIATWMLFTRIPSMLKHYNQPITVDNVLTVYNVGIGSFLKGERNPDYLRKYKLKEALLWLK